MSLQFYSDCFCFQRQQNLRMSVSNEKYDYRTIGLSNLWTGGFIKNNPFKTMAHFKMNIVAVLWRKCGESEQVGLTTPVCERCFDVSDIQSPLETHNVAKERRGRSFTWMVGYTILTSIFSTSNILAKYPRMNLNNSFWRTNDVRERRRKRTLWG